MATSLVNDFWVILVIQNGQGPILLADVNVFSKFDMSLETIKSVSQIAFWVSAIVLALLTYLNAKKTLLSPVNTEYQKRIFDTLTRINERLCSELKIGDERHFVRQLHMRQALEEICHEWKSNGASVEQHGLDLPDWPASREWHEFRSRMMFVTPYSCLKNLRIKQLRTSRNGLPLQNTLITMLSKSILRW